MIRGLFGQGTSTSNLRAGLDELSATQKTIAARVANSSAQSSSTDFADALGNSIEQQNKDAELQQNMASLADTELRFEAAAKLLQKSYADLHTAITNRG
ncbi:MAG: hypothetical protein V4558_07620 [Gemmatimonadota bacterium]